MKLTQQKKLDAVKWSSSLFLGTKVGVELLQQKFIEKLERSKVSLT